MTTAAPKAATGPVILAEIIDLQTALTLLSERVERVLQRVQRQAEQHTFAQVVAEQARLATAVADLANAMREEHRLLRQALDIHTDTADLHERAHGA